MKFGGSSLRTADRIATAADLVATQARMGAQPTVVVSAMGSVTDTLLALAALAARYRNAATGRLVSDDREAVLAGTAGLSVETVGPDHPAFALDAGDNLVTFRTDRYPDRPLVVRGPGAGAEVTAAGVFAELVQIGGMIRG